MTLLDFLGFAAPPAWMDKAACRDADPADFFPEKGEPAVVARAICAGCPVQAPCLAWAFETSAEHGVFGGLTARQRSQTRLRPGTAVCSCGRSFTAAGLAAHRRWCGTPETHGTDGVYGNGCRCQLCRAAHAVYSRDLRAKRRAS